MGDNARGFRRLPGSTMVHLGVEELCDLSPCSAQTVGSSSWSQQRMNPDKRCAKQGRRICEVHVPKARLDVDGASRGKSTGGLVGREKFVILPCPTSLLTL